MNFEKVHVFYFPRTQGFACVPSQGGTTLGNTHSSACLIYDATTHTGTICAVLAADNELLVLPSFVKFFHFFVNFACVLLALTAKSP